MATETRKVLGQCLSTGAIADCYTAPNQAVISTISACNQSGWATKIRISVAVAGAADSAKQYIVFDATLQPNETETYTIGITLAATDVIRVYAANASTSFNVFGVELA